MTRQTYIGIVCPVFDGQNGTSGHDVTSANGMCLVVANQGALFSGPLANERQTLTRVRISTLQWPFWSTHLWASSQWTHLYNASSDSLWCLKRISNQNHCEPPVSLYICSELNWNILITTELILSNGGLLSVPSFSCILFGKLLRKLSSVVGNPSTVLTSEKYRAMCGGIRMPKKRFSVFGFKRN